MLPKKSFCYYFDFSGDWFGGIDQGKVSIIFAHLQELFGIAEKSRYIYLFKALIHSENGVLFVSGYSTLLLFEVGSWTRICHKTFDDLALTFPMRGQYYTLFELVYSE